ncbi:MAG TPA: Uma2 family endonuclease [Ktedonobacteraceae bacterium]
MATHPQQEHITIEEYFELCRNNPDVRYEYDYIQYSCAIFEVLSPGTEATDRGRKFRDYQQCLSLQEYIPVSSHDVFIEIFKREKDLMWTYRAYKYPV